MPYDKERVVVTGIGIIAANCDNCKEFLSALMEGKSGIRQSTMFKK